MRTESPGTATNTLRSLLKYEPQDLKFGTSGRRGLVADLTQLEVYINALAELEYLQSLPLAVREESHGAAKFSSLMICVLLPQPTFQKKMAAAN